MQDVYNVEARDVEPVGGAPKFVTKVKQLAKVCSFPLSVLNPERLEFVGAKKSNATHIYIFTARQLLI